MKKYLLIIITLSAFFAQDYTVSRIQIIGNHHTDSDFLKNFILVEAGDVYSLDELKAKAAESELKLSNTFYFYGNKVSVIPLKNKRAKVLVKITEGFLYRFGGEAGFGFGQENLFGNGYSYLVSGSSNGFTLEMKKRYVMNTKFNLGLQLSTRLRNRNDLVEGLLEEDYRSNAAGIELGYSFQPDLVLSAFYQHQNTSLNLINHTEKLSIFGAKFYYKAMDNDLFPKDGFMFSNYYESYDSKHLMIMKFRYYQKVTNSLFIASKFSAGNSSGSLDPSRKLILNHIDAFVAENYTNYSADNAGFMTEVQIIQELAHTPPFNSTLYAGLFYQAAKLSSKLEFNDPLHSTGFVFGMFIPNPVLLRIEGKYGFTESGNTFSFTMGLNLGVLNEL